MAEDASIQSVLPRESLSVCRDRGLSLVEIVVAMFLLALVSVSFLPLLINALQVTIRNATIATATQVLNEQLDTLLTTPQTCEALTEFGEELLSLSSPDRRGVQYQPVRSVSAPIPPEPAEPSYTPVGSCEDLAEEWYPARVDVEITIALMNTTVNDVTLTTSVLLRGP